MAAYRVFQIKDKHIAAAPTVFEADTDQVAIEQAKKFVEGCDVELWEGPRFVIVLRKTDKPRSPAASNPSSDLAHPRCPTCDVPMWLVKVELGEIAAAQEFECKVCDRKLKRAVPREQNSTDSGSRPI